MAQNLRLFRRTAGATLGVLVCMCALPARCAEISLAEQTAAAGAAAIVPVVLDPQGAEISGVQFDVAWDDTALEMSLVLGDQPRIAGKNIYSAPLGGPNSLRYLLAGFNPQVVAAGELVKLFLFVRSSAAPGAYEVRLSNVIATDPRGQPIPLSGTIARVNVQSADVAVNNTILQAGGVMNAASMIAGPVTPGEIIALLGPGTAILSPAENASDLSVVVNGARAPVLYTGPHQINAAVPFIVEVQPLLSLEVRAQNRQLAAAALPVVPAAPGLFTQDGSGAGPAAMFNEDGTMNTYSNPAARGSVVTFYGTGFGLTDPPGVDGEVATEPAALIVQIAATIGGRDAEVIYAGAAPGQITGVMKIQVQVPDTAPSGMAVPVSLRVGASATQAGVTLSIR